MSYFKSGTVEVRGKRYDYAVTQLKSGEYKCVVQGCPGACMTKSDEIVETDIAARISAETWKAEPSDK